MTKRWRELTASGQVLHEARIHQLIDETVADISDAVNRQQQVWNIDINFGERIANMKSFISQRSQWISNQLNSNILDCENVITLIWSFQKYTIIQKTKWMMILMILNMLKLRTTAKLHGTSLGFILGA